MTMIVECAESGVLLVIPEGSHVWRRFAAVPDMSQQDRGADGKAPEAGAPSRVTPAPTDS